MLSIDKSLFEEIVTDEEFSKLNIGCKGYYGVEPSGIPHLGHILVIGSRLRAMMEAGIKMKILLADWHAMVNDKFGGNLDEIRKNGEILKKAYEIKLKGLNPEFLWATDLIENKTYMEGMLRSAKSTTLSRLKRSLPIMGRTEEDAESDFSKFLYPIMQVNDIFELGVDAALGGMDQRHAHMLARDIADKLGKKKVVSFHSPLLGSLKGSGRMDNFQKMSKSDPGNAILISDSESQIIEKIKNAYCPMKVVDGNPIMDIARVVIFPEYGKMNIERPIKKGGDIVINNYKDLSEKYLNGEIHPLDLKAAVGHQISELMKPFSGVYE